MENKSKLATIKELLYIKINIHNELGAELYNRDPKVSDMLHLYAESTNLDKKICCLLNAIAIYASRRANSRRNHITITLEEYSSIYNSELNKELDFIINYLECRI